MQKKIVFFLCLVCLVGLLAAQTTISVNFNITIDYWYGEGEYNLQMPDSSYYWEDDQGFGGAYENHNFNLDLEPGNYTFLCFDSYGDGGIGGVITDNYTSDILASWSSSDYSSLGINYFTVEDPTNILTRACNPTPPAVGLDIDPSDVTLTWDWGNNNAMYAVYFGDDPEALSEVVALSEVTGSSGSYHVGALGTYHHTYYWRVDVTDEVTRSYKTGTVWQFTTPSLDAPLTWDYLEAFNEIGVFADTDWVTEGTMPWSYTDLDDGYCLSAMFWNYDYGYYTNLYPPQIDLSYVKYLAFDWSHKYYSSYPNDKLEVGISFDGGITWTTFWSRTGAEFESNDGAGNTSPGTFTPELLDLRDYSGLARIRFHAFSGYGPNLYLDNIHLIVPQPPMGDDVYISEVSDNLPGQDDGTGFIELYNKTDLPIDLSGHMILQGNDVSGTFENSVPYRIYILPAGTFIDAHSLLTIGNGADETTFKTAWGITHNINYVSGTASLDITNGWAYQLSSPLLRAEIDHSPNVPAGEEVEQTTFDIWTPGTPAGATPGGVSDGQALPVELSSFTAIVTASKTVMLEWMTQSETGMIGYHVLRGDTNVAAEAIRLTDMVIEAENSSDETAYKFEDTDVAQQRSYYYWLEALSADGETDLFGPVFATVLPDTPHEPDFYATTMLQANCPNPFNPSTEIAFELRGTEGVPVQAELAVYNVRGQLVKTLVSGMMEPGAHSVTWNGTDENGRAVSSGVYFYRLTAPNFNQMRKMMLLK